MEDLIESSLINICKKYHYDYIKQATAQNIYSKYEVQVPTDKAKRRFDYVVKTLDKIYIIEANYYSGAGSKLKSVAGEFSNLYKLVKSNTVNFLWITDGKGWLTAQNPLMEAYFSMDYILNLKMLENNILEEILSNEL